MQYQSFVGRTGQMKRMGTGVALMVIGAAVMLSPMPQFLAITRPETFGLLLFGGIAITLIGFLWLSLLIRCPSCRAKLFWRAVSQAQQALWFRALMQTDCPACGYTPSPSS